MYRTNYKFQLNDLFFSVAHLQMDIADADVKTLFASLEDTTDAGFISKEAWVQAVTSANTSDILKSRGVSMYSTRHLDRERAKGAQYHRSSAGVQQFEPRGGL